jgi:pimeloyl-ACP methyl ester carboxylesterase
MACSCVVDPAVDYYLYPRVQEPGTHCPAKFPTYNVGGVQCVVVTRADAKRTILYCHGNAVVVQDLLISGVASDFVERCKCNFVAPTYPERRATGRCHDKEIIDNVRKVYDTVKQDYCHDIYMVGRSLGAAVAAYACVRHPPAGLVLLSGFSSLRAMTRWPAIGYLIGNRLDTEEVLGSCLKQTPKCIIHGSCDDLVSPCNALRLGNASENAAVHIIEGMSHSPDCHWATVVGLVASFVQRPTAKVTGPRMYPLWHV